MKTPSALSPYFLDTPFWRTLRSRGHIKEKWTSQFPLPVQAWIEQVRIRQIPIPPSDFFVNCLIKPLPLSESFRHAWSIHFENMPIYQWYLTLPHVLQMRLRSLWKENERCNTHPFWFSLTSCNRAYQIKLKGTPRIEIPAGLSGKELAHTKEERTFADDFRRLVAIFFFLEKLSSHCMLFMQHFQRNALVGACQKPLQKGLMGIHRYLWYVNNGFATPGSL